MNDRIMGRRRASIRYTRRDAARPAPSAPRLRAAAGSVSPCSPPPARRRPGRSPKGSRTAPLSPGREARVPVPAGRPSRPATCAGPGSRIPGAAAARFLDGPARAGGRNRCATRSTRSSAAAPSSSKQPAWQPVCDAAAALPPDRPDRGNRAVLRVELRPAHRHQRRRVDLRHGHRLLRAAAQGQPHAHGALPLPDLRRAAGPAGDRPVVGLPGSQAPAAAGPDRRQPRRPLPRARRHRPRSGAAEGPGDRVGRRSGRALLPAHPGLGPGAARERRAPAGRLRGPERATRSARWAGSSSSAASCRRSAPRCRGSRTGRGAIPERCSAS